MQGPFWYAGRPGGRPLRDNFTWVDLLQADVGIVPYAGEVKRRGRSASPNIKYVYADIHITLVRVANGCEQ